MTHIKRILYQLEKEKQLISKTKLKTVHLEITWDCNLRCGMCPRRKGHGQHIEINNRNIQLKQIEYIKKLLPKTVEFVNIIGAGEPMIHKNFFEILQIFPQDIIFTTNGTLLTLDNINKLPNNVKSIYVSIDSPYEKEYSKLRSGSNLNKVLNNIRLLRENKPDITTNIQMLIDKNNVTHIKRMIEICKLMDISLKIIYPICFTKKMNDNHITNKKNIETIFNKIEIYAKQNKIKYKQRHEKPTKTFCNAPFNSLLIAINGDVYPCCYIYEGRGEKIKTFEEWFNNTKKDVPMSNYIMGNVFDVDDIDIIWNGDKFNHLRNHIMKSNIPKSDLTKIRKNINLTGFNYCDVCLYKWGMAC